MRIFVQNCWFHRGAWKIQSGFKKFLPLLGGACGLGVLGGGIPCLQFWGVSWESPEPAAVEFAYFFESNNIHLLSGATELLFAEPVRCASFLDDGRRYRSVRQNVH